SDLLLELPERPCVGVLAVVEPSPGHLPRLLHLGGVVLVERALCEEHLARVTSDEQDTGVRDTFVAVSELHHRPFSAAVRPSRVCGFWLTYRVRQYRVSAASILTCSVVERSE